MKRIFLTPLFLVVSLCFASGLFALEPIVIEPTIEENIAWYDATKMPVENKCWDDVDRYFARLPSRAKGVVTDAVWMNAQFSAGEVLRFKTDAPEIQIRYALYSSELEASHLAPMGQCGCDLYAFDEETNKWRWVACSKPSEQVKQETWISGMEPKEREYMVYLPTYNGIESLSFGVPTNSSFVALSPRTEKPIVYYGTSITHGGCASRPGNIYTAMIGRRLDIPVVNLGFSGSARMELPIAELMSEIDAEVYVLDALPNMDPSLVAARAKPFILKLRERRPDVPILLVEDRYMGYTWIRPSYHQTALGNHEQLRKIYDELKANDPNLYYLSAENLLDEDLDNDATMDGSHLSDLGMYRQANKLEEVLRPILEKARANK